MTGRGGQLPVGAAKFGSPAGFGVLLGLYLAAHVTLRLLASPTLNIDDAREAVLGQTLEWGYQARQPPLYDWVVWIAFHVFGVSVATLTLLKYSILGLAYVGVYATGRRMLGDDRLATLAAFSLILLLPIGWTVHEDLTHGVAALAACAGTLYLLTRLEASGDLGSYLALGVIIGLGTLSKFTYVVCLVVLVLAGLTLRGLRRRLLDRRIALSLSLAAVIVTPFAVWLTTRRSQLLYMYVTQIRADRAAPYWYAAATGLYYLVRVTLYYVTPLSLLILVVFPRAGRRLPNHRVAVTDTGRLVGRFLLTAFVLLVIAALANTIAYLKFRWLIPVFFPLPLYAFWRVAQTPYDERHLRRYAAVLLVAELLFLGGLSLRVRSGSMFKHPYELNLPYDVVASHLAEAGFGHGTAVVGRGRLAGNLRLWFPYVRVISLEHASYIPPSATGGQCLIAWEPDRPGTPPADLLALLDSALDAHLTGREPIQTIEAPYRFAPGYLRRVQYILLPSGVGGCR